MKLKRILIEDFKQFAGRVLIDELTPGLNIFTGPNESGKTSIATAVRTVFLEKHRSSTLKHLVPWQSSSGQPRVEVEFTAGTRHYVLRKSFVTKARCELIRDGQHRFEGEEAEEALSVLLRFSRPGRGSATAEHGGIPGLLWVTQGQAQEVDRPVMHAATHLRDALNQLSGAKAESGEDILIAAVNKELHALLTEKTRKPTGDLAAVDAQLQEALDQQQHLRQQQSQFENDVDRLVNLQAEYDDVARKKPWEALEKKAAEVHGKVEELRAAKRTLEQLDRLHEASQSQIRLLREREQDAQTELATLPALEAECARSKQAADDAAAELHELLLAMEQVASGLEQSQKQFELALAAEQARDLQSKAGWQREELVRLEKSLHGAGQIHANIKAMVAQASEANVDEPKLRTLRTLESTIATLQGKMEAAGTRIEYQLASGKIISVEGELLQDAGYKILQGTTTLHIPEVGEVCIVPGASNVADLAAEHSAKKAEQAALFLALGVSSLADAEARLSMQQSRERELDSLNKQLSIYAPKGMEALERAVEAARASLRQTEALIAAMPDVSHAPALQEAKDRVEEAKVRHSACEKRHREVFEKRSRLEAQARSTLDQLEKKRQLFLGEEWQERQRKGHADLVDALATANARQSEIAAARRKLEELSAEVSEDDVERYSKSAKLQREAHTKQKGELIALGAKLEQLGASGLGERLADASALVEQLKRRKDELSLRAEALALLSDVMVEERDKTVQRLQAPLLSRLEHYCKKLFPQAAMSLDDHLSPALIKRDGWSAELAQLSFGTQEQLGILCRLAYADLLHEAQVPTLLILDDAVVHTDAARRDRIKRALLDAVDRHQILVFTCHPEAWNDLGIAPRSIQSTRVG